MLSLEPEGWFAGIGVDSGEFAGNGIWHIILSNFTLTRLKHVMLYLYSYSTVRIKYVKYKQNKVGMQISFILKKKKFGLRTLILTIIL